MDWHARSVAEVAAHFQTDPTTGLTDEQFPGDLELFRKRFDTRKPRFSPACFDLDRHQFFSPTENEVHLSITV